MTTGGRVVTSCPECEGPAHSGGGWPPWCPACEWGLVPETSQPTPEGRVGKWLATRAHQRVLDTHRKLLGRDLRASGGRRVLATSLAVLVHLTTLGMVIGVAWLWTTPAFVLFKVVATLLGLGIAWEVRPRLGRLPRDADVFTPADAPHSFAVIAQVAQATGARTPDLMMVDARFNAAVSRIGLRGRRVLVIGLPLWAALDDSQRLALLGHESGHEVNGDLRSGLLVGTAIQTLQRWSWLLRPDARATRRRWAYGGTGGVMSLFTISEYLLPVVLLPLSVAMGLLAVVLGRIGNRSGQRAEYRADELSAQVAGTGAALGLLDQFFAADSCVYAMQLAARADRNADVLAAGKRFLDAVTPAQLERWRRLAKRERHRTDASHPPTLLRQEMLRSRPDLEPAIQVDPALLQAMTGELCRDLPAVTRALRDAPLR